MVVGSSTTKHCQRFPTPSTSTNWGCATWARCWDDARASPGRSTLSDIQAPRRSSSVVWASSPSFSPVFPSTVWQSSGAFRDSRACGADPVPTPTSTLRRPSSLPLLPPPPGGEMRFLFTFLLMAPTPSLKALTNIPYLPTLTETLLSRSHFVFSHRVPVAFSSLLPPSYPSSRPPRLFLSLMAHGNDR